MGAVARPAMGIELELSHQLTPPASQPRTLLSHRDYGTEVQVPTTILRFALPRSSHCRRLTGRGFGRFVAGDLPSVLPTGSTVPRAYSLASRSRDGFVEIVVENQSGGLCSGPLTALEPGDRVSAFLRRNPAFHSIRGRAPLILIGARTGIGPLAGFVRGHARGRPIQLLFGMRHPDSDFLYREELAGWQAEGRLARLVTVVSRGSRPPLRSGCAARREREGGPTGQGRRPGDGLRGA